MKHLLYIFRFAIAILIGAQCFYVTAQQNPPPPASTTPRSVAWNPDGIWIARAFQNGTVDVINNNTGAIVFTFNNSQSPATAVTWRPGAGSTKLVAAINGNVYVWNVPSTTILLTLPTSGAAIYSLDWTTQNGDKIVGASYDGPAPNLRVWDAITGQLTFGKGLGQLATASWNPTGAKLVIGNGLRIETVDIATSQNSLLSANSYELSPVTSVAWSPDGSKIANAGVFGQVTFYNALTGQFIAYSEPSRSLVRWISWSNDSTRLASASWDGTVRIWNAANGALISTIQPNGGRVFSVDWSPDNSRIVVGSENGAVQTFPAPSYRPNSGTGLRVQYFDNLNFVTPKYYVLTPTVNFNWAASAPTGIGVDTFSARWVGKIEPLLSEAYTFYVTHDDGARLWVNGQQVVNNWTNVASAIVDSGTITLAAGVKYDITLEYYENTANASVKLEWQSTSQARQVVPKTQLYAPEGQLTFTGQIGTNNDVYVINPDGTGTTTIANSAASDSGGIWSPDGTKVAFVSQRDGNQEIYMANADGTGLRRLTNNVAVDKEPCWSPDGTKIIFSSARTGGGDIYSMDITGTGVPTAVRLTTNALNEYRPMYSPVGTKITYVMDTVATGPDIFMMNPDGTSVVQLTTRGGNDVAPFWSPDGTKIALRADISGRGQIFIVTVSPLSVVQATNTATGANYFQSWAPDSSKILFMSTRTGNAEVFTMDTTGNYTNNNQTNLTNTTASSESYAVWAPDGRSIAYSRDSRIWVMNADGSNQRQLTTVTNRYDYEIAWWQPLQIA